MKVIVPFTLKILRSNGNYETRGGKLPPRHFHGKREGTVPREDHVGDNVATVDLVYN